MVNREASFEKEPLPKPVYWFCASDKPPVNTPDEIINKIKQGKPHKDISRNDQPRIV